MEGIFRLPSLSIRFCFVLIWPARWTQSRRRGYGDRERPDLHRQRQAAMGGSAGNPRRQDSRRRYRERDRCAIADLHQSHRRARASCVLPGFTDCHIHFMRWLSRVSQRSDLKDAKSSPRFRSDVKEFAAAHPEDAWILGRAGHIQLRSQPLLPDKKFLDASHSRPPGVSCRPSTATARGRTARRWRSRVSRATLPILRNGIIRARRQRRATGALKEDRRGRP